MQFWGRARMVEIVPDLEMSALKAPVVSEELDGSRFQMLVSSWTLVPRQPEAEEVLQSRVVRFEIVGESFPNVMIGGGSAADIIVS